MDLLGIVVATLVAGVGSVWLAALLLRLAARQRRLFTDRRYLLSLAAGALLATAFVHLLPEGFASHDEDPAVLFGVLLGGLVLFFLLDKVELWHHGHEHGQDGHGHQHLHGHDHDDDRVGRGHAHHHGGGTWAVLTGDSVHCFGDGIVIASAYMANPALGALAALAVLAHEVPHHIGDLVVLHAGSDNSRTAVVKLTLAGMVTALGGVIGWWLLEFMGHLLPYLLVLASSSFIYVALADLIPQLQTRQTKRQSAVQAAWLGVGIALVAVAGWFAHAGHAHEHHGGHDHAHDHVHGAGPHRQ